MLAETVIEFGTARMERILEAGELRYDGSSPVTAMIPYREGVLVAFTHAGGNGNRIWYSPDGKNLGGGELRYDGGTLVRAMLAYKDGVFTAFQGKGSKDCGGDIGCNIEKEGGKLLKGIGETAVSIGKNPVEILPVCWFSPQECRDDAKKKNATVTNPPTIYSASARVNCVDATTGADRANSDVTVTSPVSRDAAVNEIVRLYRTQDLCQGNGDTSRRMVGPLIWLDD
jgi:hypothetical protein